MLNKARMFNHFPDLDSQRACYWNGSGTGYVAGRPSSHSVGRSHTSFRIGGRTGRPFEIEIKMLSGFTQEKGE